MPVATDLRKTVDEARAALTDAKPLHALAGAGDLLVAQVRTLATAQLAALESVRVEPAELPARAAATATALRDALGTLPERAQTMARTAVERAGSTYDALADRGDVVVVRIRSQQATKDLTAEAKTTTRSAKATRTTATKAAKSTASSVKSTATTARTTAATAAKTTASRAKATTTSARKTTATATKATRSAAKKVGTTAA